METFQDLGYFPGMECGNSRLKIFIFSLINKDVRNRKVEKPLHSSDIFTNVYYNAPILQYFLYHLKNIIRISHRRPY